MLGIQFRIWVGAYRASICNSLWISGIDSAFHPVRQIGLSNRPAKLHRLAIGIGSWESIHGLPTVYKFGLCCPLSAGEYWGFPAHFLRAGEGAGRGGGGPLATSPEAESKKKTWCMGPYARVDYNLTLCHSGVDSKTFTMDHWTLTTNPSRP